MAAQKQINLLAQVIEVALDDISATEWRFSPAVSRKKTPSVALDDISATEWRSSPVHLLKPLTVVALDDISATEWRRALTLRVPWPWRLHSMISVLPNGGTQDGRYPPA